MSLKVPVPQLQDVSLYQLFLEILRRAVDGTTGAPLFVDEVNQRVIVGGKSSGGNGSPFQVQSGDIEMTTAAAGVVMVDALGSGKKCRMRVLFDAASGNWVPDFVTL